MTYGLRPSLIILTSRSNDEPFLCVLDCPVSKLQPASLSNNTLCDHLPIIAMEQFNSHITAPLLMSGFVDLPKTTRAFHFPSFQVRVSDLHVRGTAAQCHSSLEEEEGYSYILVVNTTRRKFPGDFLLLLFLPSND